MKSILILYIRIFLYYLFRIFPVQKNKIFIQNFNGKGYGDNPKYIIEEILRRELNYTLVWSVAPMLAKNFPRKVKTVPHKSIRAIYEEATAQFWIDNCRKQLYVRKRDSQYYIQTWHGMINCKKVEKDAEEKLSAYYVKQAKYDSTLANLFISDSTFSSQLYRSAFWYNGEILECGSPRGDILVNHTLNQSLINKVKNHFQITGTTKIALYAPTFRDNSNVDIYDINYQLLLTSLQEQTKEPWVFLIRLHPNIADKSNLLSYSESIINASNYNDMQELMLASDMLITDYSDCMYEFALMNKPVFLYANDHAQYSKERGFYFDLFSMPFPCAVTNSELADAILHFDSANYVQSLEAFFQKVGVIRNGDASKKVVDRLIMETGI